MSENALMVKEMVFLTNGEEMKLTGTMVKNYLTRGNGKVTDQETVMFMNLCKYQKLNPFLNEAYLVKFGEQPAQIITSKEAYMKRAENHPQYDGMKAGIIVQRGDEVVEVEGSFTLKDDILLGGWAEIWRKERKYPFVAKVSLDEYNKGQSTWKQMPKTMIRKTAIVQALREAFPTDLGGIYTEEEEVKPSVAEQVQEETQKKGNKKSIDITPEPAKETPTTKENSNPQEQMKIENGPGF